MSIISLLLVTINLISFYIKYMYNNCIIDGGIGYVEFVLGG